jgi:hypothetical protein
MAWSFAASGYEGEPMLLNSVGDEEVSKMPSLGSLSGAMIPVERMWVK